MQFFVNVGLKQTAPPVLDLPIHDEEQEFNHTHVFEWVQVNVPFSTTDTLSLSDAIFLLLGGLNAKHEEEVQNNLHIADNGYTYEKNLLHFPLYPLMVKGLSDTLSWLFTDLGPMEFLAHAGSATILFSSVMLNTIFFIFATDRLYHLSRKVLK